MNCRSFSTTPPSPSSLCRSRLLVSLHPRVSLRTYIRRGGGAGKVSLPLHSKLPCCSLHERHNHSVCPPPPNKISITAWPPCLYMFVMCICILFTHIWFWLEQNHICSPKFQWVGCPCPPIPNMCEVIKNVVNHALLVHLVLTFDSSDIMFCNLIWACGTFRSSAMLLDIHCRPGAKYMSMSTRTVYTNEGWVQIRV